MDIFESRIRNDNVIEAEDRGEVVDSMDVRRALMAQVHNGEITLEQAQVQLKRIKASAKFSGKMTRSQVWNNTY